jgi:hypothetical protein
VESNKEEIYWAEEGRNTVLEILQATILYDITNLRKSNLSVTIWEKIFNLVICPFTAISLLDLSVLFPLMNRKYSTATCKNTQ